MGQQRPADGEWGKHRDTRQTQAALPGVVRPDQLPEERELTPLTPLGLGWPNVISVARILLAPVLALLILWDRPAGELIAAALFAVAAATDGLDGYLAR